jgi:hypothetical protein
MKLNLSNCEHSNVHNNIVMFGFSPYLQCEILIKFTLIKKKSSNFTKTQIKKIESWNLN